MLDFDPSAKAHKNSGIFGLPFKFEDAQLIYLPVPWDATTSYVSGAHKGAEAILKASHQLDLFDLEVDRPYQCGLFMEDIDRSLISLNHEARSWVEKILSDELTSDELKKATKLVNELSEKLNKWVYQEAKSILEKNKLVAVVGGDHSTPYGLIQALAEVHSDFGILHLDAHSDTRQAYMGLKHSHASIMYNVLNDFPQVTKLVQVGIRDFSEDELNYVSAQEKRVRVFWDQYLAEQKMLGISWSQMVDEIIRELPQKVYLSFDIDGLTPALCPHTGTPVPGGLEFYQVTYLVKKLALSGRTIIGLDLVEVAPHPEDLDEWDANVGMRLLYKLSAYTLASHKQLSWR